MRALIILAIAVLAAIAAPAHSKDAPNLVTRESIERGKAVFAAHCLSCHGLKYHKDMENPEGLRPGMDEKTAEAAFGVAPPDLSLMALARGKGPEGAGYIKALLTSYYTAGDGRVKNRAFADETQGDGTIAMPEPIAREDPQLVEKSADVAAFLYSVADPGLNDRERLGPYVLGFALLFTALLYILNKGLWDGLGK